MKILTVGMVWVNLSVRKGIEKSAIFLDIGNKRKRFAGISHSKESLS